MRVEVKAEDFLKLLNRALNTMEPAHQPEWATPITDHIRPTDKVEILLTREVDDSEGSVQKNIPVPVADGGAQKA
jgi:hypothetical protein